jgi:cell division protein FtsB
MFSKHHVIALGIFVIIFGGGAWLYPTWNEYRLVKRQLIEKRRDVREHEIRNDDLREDIHSLKTDNRAVERVARDRLGYCRPNEKVYEFKPAEE